MEPEAHPPRESVFDPELVADFRAEFTDAVENIQGVLIDIERAGDKHDGLHALFRALHSVKSNLRMMQLNELSEVVHRLEDILDDMRTDRVAYDSRFSDVILLCMEKIRDAFTLVFDGSRATEHNLAPIKTVLLRVHADLAGFNQHLQEALLHLDPTLISATTTSNDECLTDLEFFKQMAAFIQRRLGYAEESIQRMLMMAEQMNALAGNVIDVNQLRAAIYIHDVGMAFLPTQLLAKQAEFTPEERLTLYRHPELCADLLDHLTVWNEASQMVRQHHEYQDGQGYPRGLAGEQICAGAKLLAIVDTFESMTQSRAYREQKRTVLRVVAEINAQVDRQFDRVWVDVLNQWVRKTYSKAK